MAEAEDPVGPGKQARPSLSATKRMSSFLKEHQQYRPPVKSESSHGIDTVLEGIKQKTAAATSALPLASRPISAFRGIPSPETPVKIVDSGMRHELSHAYCVALPGHRPSRLVATLLYKHNNRRISNHPLPSPAKPASPKLHALGTGSESEIPANMAPSSSLDTFPLEPPAVEPEPLDHIYGSFVSPMCITSFLHMMSSFPLSPGSDDLVSSHSCIGLEKRTARSAASAGRDRSHLPLVVELILSPAPASELLSLADLRKHELIYRFEREWNVDVTLQPDTLWRRHPRLVVFDMDSTLIRQEVVDLLAERVSRSPELAARVADITHRAMLGELEFDSAFRERVRLLAGTPATMFDELRDVLDITPGAKHLIRALKRLGVRTAVLSGGFAPLTRWLAAELSIDHAHANEVVLDGKGRLTGEVVGRIVGKERKRELLLAIAKQECIALSQVVAVGDGANDLLMMEAAGLGVAWNAKPRVQMEADARLNGDSLLDLLYLFGLNDEDIEALTAET